MKIVVKNMVCPRCTMLVEQLLTDCGLKAKNVLLGEVELFEKPTDEELQLLSCSLLKVGFELLTEPNKQIVENVKNLIIKKVQEVDLEPHFSLSSYLKSNTLKDYSTLTKLFSEVEGCTIEKYFILQKIEKTKELLLYQQMSISEIATRLGYSSSQHLSMQFKKVTKCSPREYLKQGAAKRKSIDNVL